MLVAPTVPPNRYELLAKLSEGGMAVIYLARAVADFGAQHPLHVIRPDGLMKLRDGVVLQPEPDVDPELFTQAETA